MSKAQVDSSDGHTAPGEVKNSHPEELSLPRITTQEPAASFGEGASEERLDK